MLSPLRYGSGEVTPKRNDPSTGPMFSYRFGDAQISPHLSRLFPLYCARGGTAHQKNDPSTRSSPSNKPGPYPNATQFLKNVYQNFLLYSICMMVLLTNGINKILNQPEICNMFAVAVLNNF